MVLYMVRLFLDVKSVNFPVYPLGTSGLGIFQVVECSNNCVGISSVEKRLTYYPQLATLNALRYNRLTRELYKILLLNHQTLRDDLQPRRFKISAQIVTCFNKDTTTYRSAISPGVEFTSLSNFVFREYDAAINLCKIIIYDRHGTRSDIIINTLFK